MRKYLLRLLLLVMLIPVLSATLFVQSNPTERVTHYGTITGLNNEATDGTYAWLGIPYAAPPVGDLRWKAPVEPDAWAGTLKATAFGQPCIQYGSLFGPGANNRYDETIGTTLNTPVGSEDCLFLNIWRPATDEENLPVLVFIHGGSGMYGYTADPVYQGANLARAANAVVVTVNYRLGPFGTFRLEQSQSGVSTVDASGNFALLDNIRALRFVKENIAAFSGDPANVTIMGQSAGGILTWALVVSPLAAGLFDKAIPISGGITGAEDNVPPLVSALTSVYQTADELVYRLLIDDGIVADEAAAADYVAAQTGDQIMEYLRAKDAAVLLTAWESTSRTTGVIPEGTVLPPSPIAAIRAGDYNHVPILAGYTADEGKLFLGVNGSKDGLVLLDNAELFSVLASFNPDAPATITEADIINPNNLPVDRPFIGWNSMAAVANTTLVVPIRDTILNAIRGQQADLWVYQFDWAQEPAPWNTIYGAAHGFDLAFIFGNFTPSVFANIGFSTANAPGRRDLSEKMMQAVAAFIHTGDPNNPGLGVTWEAWPSQLHFDATLTDAVITVETPE